MFVIMCCNLKTGKETQVNGIRYKFKDKYEDYTEALKRAFQLQVEAKRHNVDHIVMYYVKGVE